MLGVLRNRNFSLLWWGGLVSMMGDYMLFVALPIYIYQATSSTLATSLMFMAGAAPRVLLGSVAGVFVDRWPRQRTMVICNLLLALGVTPLLLVALGGPIWTVYVVAIFQSSVNQFFGPAETALLPTLVEQKQLVSANALNALNNNLARFIGPAAGGVVVSFSGLAGVVVFDLASYLVAAGLIALMNLPIVKATDVRQARRPLARTLRALGSEWREGLRVVLRRRMVALLVGTRTLTSLGEGVFSVLLAPFVTEVFRGGALELGWLLSAQAVGGIVGGVAIGWLGGRVAPAYLLGFGALLLGLIDLIIFNYPAFFPNIIPALVLMAVVGIPASGFGTGYTTLMQTHIPDKLLGRVFGTVGTSSALAMLLGMAVAGILGDRVGVVPVINTQGVVYILAGFFVLAWIRPRPAKTSSLHAPASTDEQAM